MLNFKNISPLAEKRILRFLNMSFRPSDILRALANRPQVEGDYGIGPVVAKRIIDAKGQLPTRRFQKLSDLNGIKGFGQEKFEDIAELFKGSTAEKFKTSLYNGVLYDNFPVRYHCISFSDDANFLAAVNDEEALRTAVKDAIGDFAASGTEPSSISAAENQIANAYIDIYEDGHVASFSFALWFYQFDQDNWFSFERMRLQIENYLSEVHNTGSNKVFALFKGFNHRNIGQGGITTDDLPVVFSQEELCIHLWTAQLFD